MIAIACRIETIPTSNPRLVTVDPRPTAVVAQTTTWAEFPTLWSRLLDEVYRFVRPHTELVPDPGADEMWRNVMLYKTDEPAVEVGVLVAAPFAPHGRVVPSQLPGGRVATATHRGDYRELGRTHDAVIAWVADQGLERAGPRWEIYGHHRDDPNELETEVYWLLR